MKGTEVKICLTGASGFVGSHVLRHLLQNTDAEIVCPVSFRHRGLPARMWSAMQSEDAKRVRVVLCDLAAPIDRLTELELGRPDVIMNVASDSHVDRSIEDPGPFIANNVALMTNLLDYARRVEPRMFLQMSTDEVYGPAHGKHRHMEWETPLPSNPYAASKAMQEMAAISYWRTYGVPVVITNTMNIIGEMQDAEKMVPKTISRLMRGVPMPVHTDPKTGKAGSRFYLHARNLADAWLHILNTQTPQMYPEFDVPSRFHIVGEREIENDTLVHMIAEILRVKPLIDPIDFHGARPGHDPRYALDGTKLADTGWRAPVPLIQSLARTVAWYHANPSWLEER